MLTRICKDEMATL